MFFLFLYNAVIFKSFLGSHNLISNLNYCDKETLSFVLKYELCIWMFMQKSSQILSKRQFVHFKGANPEDHCHSKMSHKSEESACPVFWSATYLVFTYYFPLVVDSYYCQSKQAEIVICQHNTHSEEHFTTTGGKLLGMMKKYPLDGGNRACVFRLNGRGMRSWSLHSVCAI